MQPTTPITTSGFLIDLGTLLEEGRGNLANGLNITVIKLNQLNRSFEEKINKKGIPVLKILGAVLLGLAFYELFPAAYAILKIAVYSAIAIGILFNKNIITGRDIPKKI